MLPLALLPGLLVSPQSGSFNKLSSLYMTGLFIGRLVLNYINKVTTSIILPRPFPNVFSYQLIFRLRSA